MVISGLYRPSFSSRIALLFFSKRKTVHRRKFHIKFIIKKKIKQLLVWHYGKKAITLQPLLRELDSRMKQV